MRKIARAETLPCNTSLVFMINFACREYFNSTTLMNDSVAKVTLEGPSRVGFQGRVIPKALKMEPTAVVLGAQHKQWGRENKPMSHNWKKEKALAGLTYYQLVRN